MWAIHAPAFVFARPPPSYVVLCTGLISFHLYNATGRGRPELCPKDIHKNVTGCLILSRPDALIIRAGGRDFEPSGPGAHDRSERLRRVVKLVRQTMDTLSSGVGEVDEGDDLGFVRIRTTRYEMMISPSERYILVVLSDPNVSP